MEHLSNQVANGQVKQWQLRKRFQYQIEQTSQQKQY